MFRDPIEPIIHRYEHVFFNPKKGRYNETKYIYTCETLAKRELVDMCTGKTILAKVAKRDYQCTIYFYNGDIKDVIYFDIDYEIEKDRAGKNVVSFDTYKRGRELCA